MAKDIKHRFADMIVIEAAKVRVKFKDYFHLKNLYIMMHEWVVEEGYATRDDHNFPEEFYYQRETQTGGNELIWWWRLKRVPLGNSYFRYLYDVDVNIIELKDVEVMHQGQKFKTYWGEIEVAIHANLELDYQKQWRTHWFLKHFNKVFHQRIMKHNLDMHRITLYREAYRLEEAVKTYLQLKKFWPEPELGQFVPPKGLGETQ